VTPPSGHEKYSAPLSGTVTSVYVEATRDKTETGLITTIDRQGAADDEDPDAAASVGDQVGPDCSPGLYQLTHVYLVHSLRDWLTRKQRET
jgi:hypothetical protein